MNKGSNKIVAIGLGYVNIIVHTLVSFVLTPIMIAIWGDASYGVYKIILSFMTYFMLIDSGIRNTVIRFVSEYRAKNDRDNERRYIATISSYYLIAAGILCAFVFIFSKVIPSLYAKSLTAEEIDVVVKALPWLTLYTVATLFFNCFTALIRGHNKQVIVQTVNILRTVARFVILYLALKMGTSVVNAVMIDCVIAVLFAVIVLVYVFIAMKLPPKFEGINKAFIINIVSFTSVMLVLTVSDSLFWSVGNFLVGIMTSSVLAAVYTTAITLTNIFQSLASTVSQVFVPDIMTKSIKSSDMNEINKLTVYIGKIKSYVMYPIVIGFAVFGKTFVRLWIGDGYDGSYIIALLIMAVLVLGLIQDVPNNYVLAHNRHKKMAIATFIGAVINILVSVLFIKIWGVYGAAIGTVISYFSIHIVYTYVFYGHDFGFQMFRLYSEVVFRKLPFLIPLIVVGVAINNIPIEIILGDSGIYGWISLVVKIIVFCLVYVLVLFWGLMNKKERYKVMSRIRR